MGIRVQTEDFDVGREIALLRGGDARVGAVASFVGIVRDLNDAATVRTLTLEHYPGMTERELERIEAEARARWPLASCVILHRTGTLRPSDNIVLVLTASSHRDAAFEAAEFLMDYLKTRAPFWKRESGPDGSHWVEADASDEAATARWDATKDAAE